MTLQSRLSSATIDARHHAAESVAVRPTINAPPNVSVPLLPQVLRCYDRRRRLQLLLLKNPEHRRHCATILYPRIMSVRLTRRGCFSLGWGNSLDNSHALQPTLIFLSVVDDVT